MSDMKEDFYEYLVARDQVEYDPDVHIERFKEESRLEGFCETCEVLNYGIAVEWSNGREEFFSYLRQLEFLNWIAEGKPVLNYGAEENEAKEFHKFLLESEINLSRVETEKLGNSYVIDYEFFEYGDSILYFTDDEGEYFVSIPLNDRENQHKIDTWIKQKD